MNRSHRRFAVMGSAVTAGVVCGTVGFLTAAPTAADADAGRDGAPGVHRHGTRSSGRVPQRDAADRHGVQPGGRGTASGTRPGGGHPATPGWPWPCPDWPYWPPLLPPADNELDNRNVFFIGDDPETVAPPPAVVTATTVSSVPGLNDLANPAAVENPGAPPGGMAESASPDVRNGPDLPVNPPSAGPMAPSPPRPSPPPPSGAPKPAGSPSPPTAPQPAAPRGADLANIAAQALPGLIGLVTLAGAGGLLGYRQAKAGFALRAAGTAGFLP